MSPKIEDKEGIPFCPRCGQPPDIESDNYRRYPTNEYTFQVEIRCTCQGGENKLSAKGYSEDNQIDAFNDAIEKWNRLVGHSCETCLHWSPPTKERTGECTNLLAKSRPLARPYGKIDCDKYTPGFPEGDPRYGLRYCSECGNSVAWRMVNGAGCGDCSLTGTMIHEMSPVCRNVVRRENRNEKTQ